MKLETMKKFLFLISFVLACLAASFAWAATDEPITVRTGLHEGFNRVVIEFPKRIRFGVVRRGEGTVHVQMRGSFSLSGRGDRATTPLVEVGGISSKADAKGILTTLVLKRGAGTRLEQSIRTNPFRIVIDIYPATRSKVAGAKKAVKTGEKPGKAKKKRKMTAKTQAEKRAEIKAKIKAKREAKAEAKAKAKAEAKAKAKAEAKAKIVATRRSRIKSSLSFRGIGPVTVAFNNGWRWEYRQEAVDRLRHDIALDEKQNWEVLKDELGVEGESREDIIREADLMAARLAETGETDKAEIIKAAVRLFNRQEDPQGFEDIIRLDSELSFSHMGYFYLGDYNEKMGFYPEAAGYYTRITKERKEGVLYAATLFRKGRLMFLQGRMGKAKAFFLKSMRAGSPEAPAWLANTLLVKGEVTRAWRIYKGTRGVEAAVQADPVTALSIGDISVVRGEFESARGIFEQLQARYSKEEFKSAFFKLKIGDAYLAEGNMPMAERIYSEVKHMMHGEEWAMATLALADSLALHTDMVSLEKAEELYAKVAAGEYIGTEASQYSLAATLIKLEKYDQAMAVIEGFPSKYPTSRMRGDVKKLSGPLAYNWIKTLYDVNDHHGVSDIYIKYGKRVPFGKKVESDLMAGKSLYALGLYPDAVASLDVTVKAARGKTAEEAMLTLARVYLKQGDGGAAVRMMSAFTQRFPKSRKKDEVEEILFRASYISGDYEGVLARGSVPETEWAQMIRAHSLYRLKRYDEAVVAYESVAEGLSRTPRTEELLGAYIGMANAYFAIEKYSLAIDNYKHAVSKMRQGHERDKSWALYRIAQSHARLNESDEKAAALGKLMGREDKFGSWARTIFKDGPVQFISTLVLPGVDYASGERPK